MNLFMLRNELIVNVSDLFETNCLGRVLADCLPEGAVVALMGTLGAGKTCFVRAIAEHLGVTSDEVSSPTFVLLRQYDGNRPIYHFDTYRLNNENEFRQLSPDDYFEGNGVTFVEWADKFPNILPEERLEIRIEISGDNSRCFRFTAYGNQYETIVEKLRAESE
jgi:tRNA threonylcarbamoyladenosine biosynthesis protein TsaE